MRFHPTLLVLFGSLVSGAPVLRADIVLEWNEAMTHYNESLPPPGEPPTELRAYAMAHLALLRVVTQAPAAHAQPAAAGAKAAHDVLANLLPGGTAGFDALLVRQLALMPEGPDKQRGLDLGAETARRLLAERADDGVTTAEGPYQPDKEAGRYQFTPPFDRPPFNGYAHFPKLGRARPFVLRAPDQFRAPPPYAVRDAEYAFDFNEVKVLGAADSPARTADQTACARFWFETAAFSWNRIARELAAGRTEPLAERARLFALLNVAMTDALIAGFDSKYTYQFWRPLTAIQAAADDGNPLTGADPSWQPLMLTPPMPDYISTHSAVGAAAATVLSAHFGDGQTFTITSTMTNAFPTLAPRTFHRLSEAAAENAFSRVYAGIHFRLACLRGLQQGRQVGEWTVQQFSAAP